MSHGFVLLFMVGFMGEEVTLVLLVVTESDKQARKASKTMERECYIAL